MTRIDVLTVGESLLRLSPPRSQRLEQAQTFDVDIAGSELNVAVLLARLGLSAVWVSRVPKGPLGRLVLTRARAQGVDVSRVVVEPAARLGVMYYEPGPQPRNTRVIYDRADSAAARLCLADADWDELISRSRWVHLTGITAALSPSAEDLVQTLAERAAKAGKPVSYDLNFRSGLTSVEEARRRLEAIAAHLDTLVIAKRDAELVLGVSGAPEVVAQSIRDRYGTPIVAVTLPTEMDASCVVQTPTETLRGERFPATVIDRLGAGDSFAAGLIYGLLRGDTGLGVRVGGYVAAMALAAPGDFNWIAPEDLEALTQGSIGQLER